MEEERLKCSSIYDESQHAKATGNQVGEQQKTV
jgi:hypothetical protein